MALVPAYSNRFKRCASAIHNRGYKALQSREDQPNSSKPSSGSDTKEFGFYQAAPDKRAGALD